MIHCGIYIIKNTISAKFYIGSTNNIKKRWLDHKRELKKNKHHSPRLQNAWNKYGEESFTFEVVEEVQNVLLLEEIEQHYLDVLKPYDENVGYNISMFAQASMRGRKHSETTKQKISDVWKKKYEEGFLHSWLGRCHSQESKNKMSKTKKEMFIGENNPFYGKTHSEETKKKLSNSRQGLFEGENSPLAKLTFEDVKKIKQLYYEEKMYQKDIAKMFNVQQGCISKIITGRSWKNNKDQKT